jgi:hypothetical protein
MVFGAFVVSRIGVGMCRRQAGIAAAKNRVGAVALRKNSNSTNNPFERPQQQGFWTPSRKNIAMGWGIAGIAVLIYSRTMHMMATTVSFL